MADLQRRLDEPQSWYGSSRVINWLGALVLAATAAAATLWFRTRRLALTAGPWYESAAAPLEPMQAPASPARVAMQPEVARPPRAEAVPVTPAIREALRMPQALPVAGSASAESGRGGNDPIAFTLPPTPRRAVTGVLRVETLAATFGEVEFLSSLGLDVDAMEVLKTYLHDSNSPAPIAYYELMRLCDHEEDAAAVAAVRRRYAQVFGGDAASLQQVTAPRGLEGVADLSERITAAWGSADVLELIEDALFSVPPPGTILTLQSGRDLLCLHELARVLTADAGMQTDAESQPLAPWAQADDPAAAQAAAHAIADADGGRHFALDVDLSAAPAPLPEKQEPAAPADPELELELAPLIAEMQAAAEHEALARAQAEAEEAFSAAVASERAPMSRY